MPRLIDADKLRINCVCLNGICVDGRTIENAPTVKAIPIEFIRNNWLKRNDNQGTIEFFPQPTFEDVMNWLIEDWEKENGRD